MLATARQNTREYDGPDEHHSAHEPFTYVFSCDSHGNLLNVPENAGFRAQDGFCRGSGAEAAAVTGEWLSAFSNQ